MKKFKILIPIIVVAVTAAVVLTVFAYLNDTGGIKNELKVGQNTINILEDFEAPTKLTSGDNTFKKSVQIENTGNTDCYVRVFLDFSDSDVKNISKLQAVEGGEFKDAMAFETTPPDGWEYIPITDGLLGGYYYYTKPLKPGEKANLLNQVRVHFNTDSDIKEFDIIVSTDSVQTKDKSGKEFDDYKSCWNEYMTRRTVN